MVIHKWCKLTIYFRWYKTKTKNPTENSIFLNHGKWVCGYNTIIHNRNLVKSYVYMWQLVFSVICGHTLPPSLGIHVPVAHPCVFQGSLPGSHSHESLSALLSMHTLFCWQDGMGSNASPGALDVSRSSYLDYHKLSISMYNYLNVPWQESTSEECTWNLGSVNASGAKFHEALLNSTQT